MKSSCTCARMLRTFQCGVSYIDKINPEHPHRDSSQFIGYRGTQNNRCYVHWKNDSTHASIIMIKWIFSFSFFMPVLEAHVSFIPGTEPQ